MGTAESCTGGGIAKYITDHPGVSDVYKGSIVTYSNEMKHSLLGVRNHTLENYGAVSSETAVEMVKGLVKKCHLQTAISITGIAGPSGGTSIKPIGLVYISSFVNGDIKTMENEFQGDRSIIREKSILTALTLFEEHLNISE